MVQMDISWHKRQRHSFALRIFTILTFASLLYVSLIRPIRININKNFIFPVFSDLADSNVTKVQYKPRRIDILPNGYDSPRGFGIPFGGYFWLPLALLIASKNNGLSNMLFFYHLFLSIVPPFFGFLFIKGYKFAGIILQANEMFFITLFLFFLFVGIKQIYNIWNSNKPLNL